MEAAGASCRPPRIERRDKTRLTRKLTVISLHLFTLTPGDNLGERAVFYIMQSRRGERGVFAPRPPSRRRAGPRGAHRRSRGAILGSVNTIPARCLELLSCRVRHEGKTHFCSPNGDYNGEPAVLAAAAGGSANDARQPPFCGRAKFLRSFGVVCRR